MVDVVMWNLLRGYTNFLFLHPGLIYGIFCEDLGLNEFGCDKKNNSCLKTEHTSLFECLRVTSFEILLYFHRLDTTLIDFTDMKCQRGDLSFIFNGDAAPSESFVVLDNEQKVYQRIHHEVGNRVKGGCEVPQAFTAHQKSDWIY